MTLYPTRTASPSEAGNERDILLTLFDLGRQVASVIDFDELLPRIPELIGRLIQFDAFAVYLFDERHGVVNIAYAIGYPEEATGFKLRATEGLVGRVITSQQSVVLGDVTMDPHYIGVVPGMASTLAVPLVHKKRSIGALNILSRERDRYSERDAANWRRIAASRSE